MSEIEPHDRKAVVVRHGMSATTNNSPNFIAVKTSLAKLGYKKENIYDVRDIQTADSLILNNKDFLLNADILVFMNQRDTAQYNFSKRVFQNNPYIPKIGYYQQKTGKNKDHIDVYDSVAQFPINNTENFDSDQIAAQITSLIELTKNKNQELAERIKLVSDKKILIIGEKEEKDHMGKSIIVDLIKEHLLQIGIREESIYICDKTIDNVMNVMNIEKPDAIITVKNLDIAKKLRESKVELPILTVIAEYPTNQLLRIINNNKSINAFINGTKELKSTIVTQLADFLIDSNKYLGSQFLLGSTKKQICEQKIGIK